MSIHQRSYRWWRERAINILQHNRPAPVLSDQELAAEVNSNYRWNFAVNMIDVIAFWIGMSFASGSTIAPLFVSKLTTSPVLIGLVAIIAQGTWSLPQLLAANLVEGLARKKPFVVRLGFLLERFPMWLLVPAALMADRWPTLALITFFVGYAWHGLGAGLVATAWQDLLANCFPVQRRGRFFGISTFVGAGMGAAGAWLSTRVLDDLTFPTDFVVLFGIASLSITLGWIALAQTREPVRAIQTPRKNRKEFVAQLPQILNDDHNFRRFLIARLLMALGNLGTGFLLVSAIQKWQVPDSTAGWYTTAYLLGQTVANLTFGLLADRWGHKLSLEFGCLAALLGFAFAWLAPSPIWYFAAFALLGVNVGAILVSGILVTMEFSDAQRRPTYIGIANTSIGLVSLVAPLLGAWLASIQYNVAFVASAGIYVIAFIAMRWSVKEPRQASVTKQ